MCQRPVSPYQLSSCRQSAGSDLGRDPKPPSPSVATTKCLSRQNSVPERQTAGCYQAGVSPRITLVFRRVDPLPLLTTFGLASSAMESQHEIGQALFDSKICHVRVIAPTEREHISPLDARRGPRISGPMVALACVRQHESRAPFWGYRPLHAVLPQRAGLKGLGAGAVEDGRGAMARW